tara:strand:+ start:776 stop:1357 length:582 start_codon:yes stop_codon:yes gene_type:complete
MTRKKLSGIILAGGKSSRMGSDKALLLYNNKTFLEHVVCAIKPLVDDILIISNNKEHQVDDCSTIPDLILNSGPIAGVYTGLKHTKTENNLVLSCDIPLVQTSILELIIKNNEPDKDVVQIIDDLNSMPLIALYKKRIAPYLLSELNKGERRLVKSINKLNKKNISVTKDQHNCLININTVADLKTLEYGIEN